MKIAQFQTEIDAQACNVSYCNTDRTDQLLLNLGNLGASSPIKDNTRLLENREEQKEGLEENVLSGVFLQRVLLLRGAAEIRALPKLANPSPPHILGS